MTLTTRLGSSASFGCISGSLRLALVVSSQKSLIGVGSISGVLQLDFATPPMGFYLFLAAYLGGLRLISTTC